MLRLRSAGVGVVVGGVALGLLGLMVSFLAAAALVFALAVTGGVLNVDAPSWIRQLFLGIGSIGALAIIEGGTSVGFGLGVFEFAALAVVFGLMDILIGTAMHTIQQRGKT